MTTGPSITTAALVDALLEAELVTVVQLSTLFGAERRSIPLNELEMTLVQQGIVSDPVLSTVKGIASGRDMYNPDLVVRADLLDRRVAKATGALCVSGRARPTIAFVEDVPDNVAAVSASLAVSDFDIILCTAPQFQALFESAYGSLSDTDRRPIAESIYEVLDEAVNRRASDIHLTVGHPPTLRVAGQLTAMNRRPLWPAWILEQMTELCGEEKMAHWYAHHDADLAISYGSARFRINLGRDRHGMIVAMRRLPVDIPNMEDLRLPDSVRSLCNLERGLVIITGPTGSGKSTTLASMLSHIAAGADGVGGRHLLTLEDPIEYTLPQGRSIVHQRELGVDFESFPGALRQALRQDPDVILVGELRDLETTRTAITAAETGHFVMGTLHTYDAVSSLGRLVNQFPEGEQPQVRAQLAYVLRAIISQTLVPTADGKGRVGAYEVLLGTPAVVNNLRKIDGMTNLRQILETGIKDGMQTLEADLANLVRQGTITRHEAEYRARNLDELHSRLGIT